MDIAELFSVAGLVPQRSVPWRTPILEHLPGVYVVTDARLGIVYVGRTVRQSLRERLGQFHRHRYGRSSPHRGGQDVKLLAGPLRVHWAPTPDPVRIESRMLEAFRARTGRLPLANKKRGDRALRLTEADQPPA